MDAISSKEAPQGPTQAKLAQVRPMPGYLYQRYRGWRATDHAENRVWYRRLAEEGQRPRCMLISCCDSRVQVTDLFGAGPGEFFVHRNIANLVPPFEPDGDHHGTSAAVEYAITGLRITNLIVVGHSLCGGVESCYAMCTGAAPELEAETSFVGRWMDILRPGFERVKDAGSPAEVRRALEKQTVAVSLANLLGFPFVAQAVEEGSLALHGCWIDIASGELMDYDPETGDFHAL